MKIVNKKLRRKLFKSITLFSGMILVLNMSMVGVFFVANDALAIIQPTDGYCELTLTKTGPETVGLGEEITYNLTLENTGDADCTGGVVKLRDDFDKNTTFVSTNTETEATTTEYIKWNFGEIYPEDPIINISLTMEVSDDDELCGEVLTNTAHFWATQYPNGGPDVIATTTVVCEPKECELTLTKTGPKTASPGDEITYNLTLENTGDADCTGGGVELMDEFDENTTFVSTNTETEATTTEYIKWNFGIIAPQATKEVELTMKVNEDQGLCDSTLVNKARFRADEYTGGGSYIWGPYETAATTIVCEPEIPYCGDEEVNQNWEQCDGGDECTDYCRFETDECSDLVLARVNIDYIENWGGDMSLDSYLGTSTGAIPNGAWFPLYLNGSYFTDPDIAGYEDVPGMAVQRLEGSVRTVMHGSSVDGKEHAHGNVEFYNATVADQISDDSNDFPKSNRLERGFDGSGLSDYNEGDDEVWTEDGDDNHSYFWLTTTVADDGYYTDWEIVEDCEGKDSFCGDGVKQTPNDEGSGGPQNDGYEECDGQDGVSDHYTCTNECILEYVPYCGDGNTDTGEQCDDGNNIDGDGCSANCTIEKIQCDTDLDVMIVMDRSGSMGYNDPTRLSQAKIAANNFLDNLRTNNDQSGLVSYSTTATLDKTLSNNHASTTEAINDLIADGATNIGDAIDLANTELIGGNANPQASKIEILLTDGLANKPNGPGYGENQDDVDYAEAKALEAAADGIIIFTIGLGDNVNDVMLQNIASSTGGEYYFAPTGDDLDEIFNQIAFKACEYGSISGCKYLEDDGDGLLSDDLTLPGWEIVLEGDNDPISQFTDELGCYAFTGLSAGDYTVSEVNQVGYIQTYPINPDYHSILLSDGENVENIDFINYFPEICQHDVGVRYSYSNSYDTGIAIRPEGGEWVAETPAELIKGNDYEIKYYIDNNIASSSNNIYVIVKIDDDIITEYDSPINSQHSQIVNLDISALSAGSHTVSVQVDKIDEIDCNMEDNYAEREIIISGGGGPEYGSIKACKYEDMDGNLETDDDQYPVIGWSFSIGSSTMETGEDGCVIFSELEEGKYTVTEGEEDDWVFLYPSDGEISTTVISGEQSLLNFYNIQYSSISGYKYEDLDGLASTTDDLVSLPGWGINLFNSSTTTPIATATTDTYGYYEFGNLLPGEYSLSEDLLDNWTQMSAPVSTIAILSGDNSENNDFVNSYNGEGGPETYCGDGTKQTPNDDGSDGPEDEGYEECDGQDGVSDHYTCTDECTLEYVPYCGDGIKNGGEECDGSEGVGSNQSCNSQCKTESTGGGGSSVFITNTATGFLPTPEPIVLGEEGEPILLIEKSVNVNFTNPGDEIEYSVKVSNTGNLTAFEVVLTDTLPAGFTFIDGGETIKTFGIGDIGPGENKTLSYMVLVGQEVVGGIYANLAEVSASNHGSVVDTTNVEVMEIEVLGVELTDTGFSVKEFILLLAAAAISLGSALVLRRRLIA